MRMGFLVVLLTQTTPYSARVQVFIEDPELPGRYKLISEKPSRPQGGSWATMQFTYSWIMCSDLRAPAQEHA